MRKHSADRHNGEVKVDVKTPDGNDMTWNEATQRVGSALRIAPAFVATATDAELGIETTLLARYDMGDGRYLIRRASNVSLRDDVELNYQTVARVGMQAIVQAAAPRCIFLTLEDEDDPLARWISVNDLTTSAGRIIAPAIAAQVVRRGSSEARMDVIELLYGSAALSGKPPAKLIQQELGIPHRTASAWIIEARKVGRLAGMNYHAGRPASG